MHDVERPNATGVMRTGTALHTLRESAVCACLCLAVACRAAPEPVSATPLAAPPDHGPAADPLPSWNDGPAKQSIVQLVRRVTTEGSPELVPESERVATFDNDGTLWVEQPMYAQLAFTLDRVKALAPQHPEWATVEPFASVLGGDVKSALSSGERGMTTLMLETHTKTTTDAFEGVVVEWLSTAKHPRFNRPYTDLVYQPMLEVLDYLRDNGFETYIVSGGGVDFMRPWTERVYGVPPERVVGSRVQTRYEVQDGVPVLVRLPKIEHVDDGPGKPVGIDQRIGRRPIVAFGNSDGDFEMLEWTTSAPGARLGVLVHHTDAAREWAYDRDSHVGKLSRALDEAPARGWIVVDMKDDWNTIFRFEEGGAPLAWARPSSEDINRPPPR